jgi:uncharacterized LabA/DUF88 family protein
MISRPNQRVGVFLDAQNIYHSAKNLHKARVNFQELLKGAISGRQLVKATAYVAKSDPSTGEESFFEALRQAGFDLRVKDLQVYSDGAKKADWDVGLAIDAMRLAPSLDVVVLITGDGDFVPLIEYIRQGLGRTVEAVAFLRTASRQLRDNVDFFKDLDSIPRALMPIGKGRSGNRGEQQRRKKINKVK